MTTTPQPDDSHAEDIIGVTQYAPEKPTVKSFLPWHKPRKQFVRKKQWCEQILKLVDEVIPENNILKYLGLPGDDLLDLRYFHKLVCEPKNLGLKFLGFNHGAGVNQSGTELNISLDEVFKLPLVDKTSDILGDDICQIANANSVAWEKSRVMGPYDVINIDLCDGLGKHPHDKFLETHYNTLYNLMTFQARRSTPWLLLLTTRTGTDHTEAKVLDILKGLYNQNLIDCEAFLQASKSKLNVEDIGTLNERCATSKGVADIFMVALCKWIGKISVGQNPPSKIEVKSVVGYQVDQTETFSDLVSIAIKISPTNAAVADKVGLATGQDRQYNYTHFISTVSSACNRVFAGEILRHRTWVY